MRTLISLLIVAALLAAAAGVEYIQSQSERADPLGRQLLYLPTPEYLRLISLGNEGLMADFFYVWAIQYYSQFKPNERYLYLDTIFDLITDLDPHYIDSYRIGALIMLIEAERAPEVRKRFVLQLLEKGIEANPDDYVLAEEAAWKCYIYFDAPELAARYARIAMDRPGAPHRIHRFYGHLQEAEWSLEQAIEYWEDILATAQTERQIIISTNHLYDLKVSRDRETLDPLLERYAEQAGGCPAGWDELVEAGLLRAAPRDPAGNEYEIDQELCRIVAIKQIKED